MSRLAQVQTEMALAAMSGARPDARFEVTGVTTVGDRDRTVAITALGDGVFTNELEASLLDGTIDLAIHSLKDLPTALPDGLCLAAVLTREDPRDALVSRDDKSLADLPPGARIGTSSPRRAAQLLARRPDLEIVLLRGNVDTRVRKVLEDGDADATVLAVAGLKRLDMEQVITEIFEPDVVMPAIGQGFLAIEVRSDDEDTLALAKAAQDDTARRCADAERAFLSAVGGGCKAPLGAYATIRQHTMTMIGMVATLNGGTLIEERVEGDFSPAEAGMLLKERLFALGAEGIIAAMENTGV
jgi:hydroxymethylbilane synthase